MSLPVWRELKPEREAVVAFRLIVWMSLPVWRELKLAEGVEDVVDYLQRSEWAFPFEGNWNLRCLISNATSFSRSEWAFPFEGNWNLCFRILSQLNLAMSEWAFPFEGNGNIKIGDMINEVLKKSEWAFPFEGNGNLLQLCLQQKTVHVWMSLPVWREWKLWFAVWM